jgi:hypothetical protein
MLRRFVVLLEVDVVLADCARQSSEQLGIVFAVDLGSAQKRSCGRSSRSPLFAISIERFRVSWAIVKSL